MLPRGWSKKRLKDVCKMQAGKFVKASEINKDIVQDEYPCYGGNGLRGYTKSYTHKGTYSLIGRQGALCGNIKLAQGYFHATEHAVVTTPFDNIDTKWLYYMLIDLNLNQYATGQAQPGLSVKNLDNLTILTPDTLLEQNKIAKILSTWDKSISTTERLIDNSKQQKKALMQQLLTGQKRLLDDSGKPFVEKWDELKLSVLSKVYDGTHSTPKYVESGIPFYSVEHLTRNDFSKTKFITKEVFDKENLRVKLERNDILMTRIGDIGTAKCLVWDVKASFYVSLALIKSSSKFNSLFLTYFINSQEFHRELWKRTIHVAFPKKINLGEIGNCLINLPPLDEQQKIASVFINADKEIELLEQQLADLKQEKKALMQQLLTGKRRVKVGKEAM